MKTRNQVLTANIAAALGDKAVSVVDALGEVTLVVKAADLIDAMTVLRGHPELRYEELMDLCGVDYQAYGDGAWTGARFAVVYHLLSLTHNRRLRVRVFAPADDFPVVNSVVGIWPS